MDKDEAHHTIMLGIMGVLNVREDRDIQLFPKTDDEKNLFKAISALGWKLIYQFDYDDYEVGYFRAQKKISAKALAATLGPHFTGYVHLTDPVHKIGPCSLRNLLRAIAREEGINVEETQGA